MTDISVTEYGPAILPEEADETPASPPIETYPWLYAWAVSGLALLYVLVGGVALFFNFTFDGVSYNIGFLVYYVGVLHYATALRVVDRANVAGVLVLGWATIERSGGIVIAPWLLCKYIEYPLAAIEIKVPRSSEKVWRGNPDQVRPQGYEEPIRIPFASAKKDGLDPTIQEKILDNDPLLNRTTQEVSFVVRIAIRRASQAHEYGFFDFYVRIGTLRNAHVQVKPVGVTKLFETLAGHCAAEVLARTEYFNRQLQSHMAKTFNPWGVDVITAKMSLNFSKSLNSSLEEVPQGRARGQAQAGEAEGTRTKLALEGLGRAEAAKAELEHRGAGMKKMMQDMGIQNPELAVAADVSGRLADNESVKYILPTGDVGGLAAALTRALPQPRNTQPTS